MKLNELRDNEGARKSKIRVGRGIGSGKGKTGGRGQKGQKSREGVSIAGFEGGQMPLHMRLPKRGFNNIFAERVEAINVSALNKFEDGATVNVCDLLEKGILSKCEYGVKVLGNGEISKKLTVRASAFSATAKEKIEKAGGKAEVV